MKSIDHPCSPRRFLSCLVLLLLSFILPPPSFAAESPLYIPFQGQVTNQAGAIAADGQYSVIFNLYDQAVGGQPVWSERHVKIGVTRGMVNVFLGSITPLTTVDFSQTKYLGITVDIDNLATTADPEMVPRSLIIPSFHAKKAENATKLAGQDWSTFFVNSSGEATNDPTTGFLSGAKVATGSVATTQLGADAVTTAKVEDGAITTEKVHAGAITTEKVADGTLTVSDMSTELRQASVIPPGTIIPFAGPAANVPLGWKLCDGSAISRTTYATLFAAIGTTWGEGDGNSTFALPNLAGAMLAGTGTGVISGRNKVGPAVGAFQEDQMQGHWHNLTTGNGGPVGGDGRDPQGSLTNAVFSSLVTIRNPINDGANGTPRTGIETRPYRAGINYIIKL